jgi:SAM-dependent methyltransferase
MNRCLSDLVSQALEYEYRSILDIGAGNGFASKVFAENGKDVTATGLSIDTYGRSNFVTTVSLHENVFIEDMHIFSDSQFDAVWCSHVLEHTQNPGRALNEIHRVLKDGGYLFIVVPEYTDLIVGGHVSTGWNIGVLMYNLVLSGFNVRSGRFINHCWNVTGFVQKTQPLIADLRHDDGDIELLSHLFPEALNVKQGFNGKINSCNWVWTGVDKDAAKRRWLKYRAINFFHSLIPPLLYRFLKRIKYRAGRRIKSK